MTRAEDYLNHVGVHLSVDLPDLGEYRYPALVLGLTTEGGAKVGARVPVGEEISSLIGDHLRRLADHLDPPPGCRCRSFFAPCGIHPDHQPLNRSRNEDS